MTDDKNELISGRKLVKIELVSVTKMFLISVLSGAIFIVLGLAFNSIILSVGAPLLVMLSYIFFMIRAENDLPISIVGDSFYYLGFILTLVALVSSLVFLSVNDDVNMNNVVGSFGAALITTIVGLVARLVVTSFSVQAQKRRERLENEIEKALNTFSAQLDCLTTQVVASVTKVHAETEVSLKETLEIYNKTQTEVTENYKESMESASDVVHSAMIDLSKRINNIDVSSDLISKPLQNSLKDIIKTLENHQKAYENINSQMILANEQLSIQFNQSGTLVSDHVDKLEGALNGTIQSQAQKYETSLSEISKSILSSLGDIKDLKQDTEQAIQSSLSEYKNQINAVADELTKIIDPVKQSTENLTKQQTDISTGMDKLVKLTCEMNLLIDATKQSSSNVLDTRNELSDLAKAINEAKQNIEEMGIVSKESMNRLSAAANATEESSSQVAKDISTVYQQLALQIKGLKGIS
ncbi:hypothetical protein BIT28_15555 [Photobacterium proteolyticum]|uniref:MotA/TolQ/ExbB proton channel domain-containing protein n=1 Tax=Photobacterium proteolyticum TaxID=1903952 RepID=A0A1Q9G8Z6_9GAMM|nr:hypothetical protein [Photobacterium proteolyticum]OLQ70826.1 hypothetical protein BIT28_15555 [Photobacterium proteolyticum]